MREKKPKKSSVRHTRAIQRDRTKRPNTAAPDEIVEARLKEVVHPATLNHVAHFHALGLRARTLNLPVMMAFVLRLIWRQIGSVREAVRTLNREGLLWVDARKVSQQALEQRFSSVPALLFERVLQEVLPIMATRWQTRTRPLPPALPWARDHFTATVAVDGSTLDALLRKTGLLRDGQGGVLGGRMAGLLDVTSRLPRHVWYEEDPHAHDQRFWDRILAGLERGMLVLFDLGFLNVARFDLHDQIVRLGSTTTSQCAHPVRLIEMISRGLYQFTVAHHRGNADDPIAYLAADAKGLGVLKQERKTALQSRICST